MYPLLATTPSAIAQCSSMPDSINIPGRINKVRKGRQCFPCPKAGHRKWGGSPLPGRARVGVKPTWGQKSWWGLPRAEEGRETRGPQGMTEPASRPVLPGMRGQAPARTGRPLSRPIQWLAAPLTLQETRRAGHRESPLALRPVAECAGQQGKGAGFCPLRALLAGRTRGGWGIRGTGTDGALGVKALR